MSFPRRFAMALGLGVIGMTLTISDSAWANGQEFFTAPFGDVDLVYTGRVRDTTGRFLARATMVVWSEEAGLTFPSITDEYGHYRSPDVGENIKEATSAPVNTKDLKATCSLPGYEVARALVVPKKNHGTVELNCTLRKIGTGAPDGAPQSDAANRPTPSFFWLVPAALVVVVTGAAIRK
jgi:hypothetical protein